MAAKLDLIRNQEEEELCVFYEETFLFEEICSSKRNLHTLIVIGQSSITSLDGISELIHLRELWVVECQIKEAASLEGCKNLEKLYLYSNQIEKIPNLFNCERLTILNLAGNYISRLRNIRGLVFLQELNLANNNLTRLGDFFPRSGNLRSVNFAGNLLYIMKDIKSLFCQKNLEFIIFADPLYGECPLVRLCYYRYHVINFLPAIKELDHYHVTDEEKNLASNFIREKKIFYNVLWHAALNDYWARQKDKYKEYYKEVSMIKSKLGIEKLLEIKFENQSFKEISEGFSKLRTQYEEIQDWEKKELDKLEVHKHQLHLKFQYSGNLNFIECEEKIFQTCKSLLEDSLCQSIRNLGVRGVTLSRVTKFKNNGVKALQSMKNPKEKSSSDVVFMFLVSSSLDTMKKWPFVICENQFFNEKEVWVSDCLASADVNWVRDFSSESMMKKYEKSLETRICVLVQCSDSLLERSENSGKFKNVHVDNNKNCQEFCIVDVEKVNPVFVLEYNYQFEKQIAENFTEIQFPLENTNRDTITDIKYQLKTNLLQNLTILNLSHQGLTRLNLIFEFPNLRELNLSCNQLTKFPKLHILKYLRVLNLSFNQIKFLNVEEKLFQLEVLDISWNNLTEFMFCIKKFEIFALNIKELNTEYNPFRDIFQSEARVTVARIYLPSLTIFDRIKIDEKIANEFKSVRKCCNGSINIFEKVIKVSTAVYKMNLNLRTLKAEKNSHRIRRLNLSGNLISDIDFTIEFPALQELCVSNNILEQFSIEKPLRNLVKLNLSSNFIKSTDGLRKEVLPVLRYLDLSNNLVSSLVSMGNHDHLREFYCYQNEINDLSEILNLRSWTELRVADFSNNGIMDSLLRTFLIFHLPNIKYVNGKIVDESDTLEAKNEFSGSLNKMTLMTSKSFSDFQNITELSIVSCSIKKVNLPLDCLPNLESLDLSKNQISYLWGLHLLPKLTTLCLSYNKVELFDQVDFQKDEIDIVFPNLITLYLDHNRIRSLQTLKLGKCLKLKHLFLQYNYLQDIDGLQESGNLETLVLDHNELRTITLENFNPSNNLGTLFLENNRIKYLCFAKNLPKLQTLLLANNKIADQNHLKELSSLCNLKELSLLGNPLCKKTRNHYKFVLQFLDNLSIVDGIEILQSKN